MIVGAVLVGWLAVSLFLGDVPLSADPYVTLANYGILGLIALGFFTGKIVSSKHYEQALKDRDRDHGELVALRAKLEDHIIPGFVRMTDLSDKLLDRPETLHHDPGPPRRRS